MIFTKQKTISVKAIKTEIIDRPQVPEKVYNKMIQDAKKYRKNSTK